jgi:hypothetical protein
MGFQINTGLEEMGALTHPGQGDGMGAVPGPHQAWQHSLPAPCAVPGTMHE